MPELRIRAVVQFLRQSADPCAAPPTSPFMALLMEPRAVKAQARFPRCSSVCGCVFLAVLRSGPEFCYPGTLEMRSLICPFPTGEIVVSFQFRVPVHAFRDLS